jgi:hypothetical protein
VDSCQPPFKRLRKFSFFIVCGSWIIVGVLAFPTWGLLALTVLIPWVISLGVLHVWHVLCSAIFRRVGRARGVLGTILLAPSVVLACVVAIASLYEHLPSNQFKRYVAGSKPVGVRSIRIGGEEAFLYEEKLIYFECSANDFRQILKEQAYEPRTQDVSFLDDLARKHLNLSLGDLGPHDVFQADMLDAHEKVGGTWDKILAVNKDTTKAIFFDLSYN